LLRLPVEVITCLTVQEEDIVSVLGPNYEQKQPPYPYSVMENGLCPRDSWHNYYPPIVVCGNKTFRLVDGKFGDYSRSQSHMKRFIRSLNRLHIHSTSLVPWFEVTFNVSSRTTSAYYRLLFEEANRRISTRVWCMKPPDETVVRNVQHLDRKLYRLMARCKVPPIVTDPWFTRCHT